jgi:hypothetical protein
MIALSNNTLAWLDAPMVRRELGADRADLPGLGFAPHALRLAHLLQHQGHVADVIQTTNGRSFAAASYFPALPPAGPLPQGAINPADFTQGYFPPSSPSNSPSFRKTNCQPWWRNRFLCPASI